ncbi:bifunctional phosphatase PAP2/diacylglycerol kinase family protein [Epidermidibacterium keratini]
MGKFRPSGPGVFQSVAHLDDVVYRRLARSHSKTLDTTMPALSRAADYSRLWMAIAAGMHAYGGRRSRRAAVRGVASIAATSLVTNQVFKRIRWRNRPDHSLVPILRAAERMPTSSSFPSGHSASAAAFATSVAMENLPAGVAVGLLAGGVGVSRVATGAHYPSDVVCGFAIGAAVAAIGAKVVPPVAPVLDESQQPTQFDLPELPDGEGLAVIANDRSGVDQENTVVDQIREALPKARILTFGEGEDLVEIADKAAKDAVALGACGGDGTIVAVAEVAMKHDLPLAVFPGGTFNHFAKDSRILSMDDAFEAVRGARGTKVDVATLNDEIFLNTASIGTYPEFVTEREKLQRRLGKRIAAVVAAWRVYRAAPRVDMKVDGRPVTAALFFVGNGEYLPRDFAPAMRADLSDGLLDVRILKSDKRGKRPRLAWATLTGTLERSGIYERMAVSKLDVQISGNKILISRDGEVDPPVNHIRFGVLPDALTIYQPDSPTL